jgi:hypothetical protein
MATNGFKINILEAKYYSKSGHDSNAGTKDSPKKSISSGNALSNVIGAGVYNDMVGFGGFHEFRADGIVKLISQTLPSRFQEFHGFQFIGNPIMIVEGNSSSIELVSQCTFIGLDATTNNKPLQSILNCTLVSCDIKGAGNQRIYSSIFISTELSASIINNSFVSLDTILSFSGTKDTFFNNNVQGTIVLDGYSYAIQDQFTGTPQDNGYAAGVDWLTEANLTANSYSGTISGWNTAIATCMNRNPLFNNPSIGDYSLQSGSPMIGAADDGIGNIGGQKVAISVTTDQDGVGDTQIICSSEIDTTNMANLILLAGEVEGQVDFIFKRFDTPTTLNQKVVPFSSLLFDSDFAGGTSQNRDVIDSHPRTADYPDLLVTTAGGGNSSTLKAEQHGLIVGNWVRASGEVREITAIPDVDTITVGTAFRAIVPSGVTFEYGTQGQFAALNPNRLTYEMRTSTQVQKPTTDAEWDNSIDPNYGQQGVFFTQEWYEIPEIVIDTPNVYGGGDTDKPVGVSGGQIQATWIHMRVFIRNNYRS